MSLVGNLEDLGLGEILQIVSLSRKSGVLTLQCEALEGKIFFREGQVFRANVNSRRENLAELLFRRGLADIDILTRACHAAQTEPGATLAQILARDHGLSAELVEGVAREAIEETVHSFFSWDRGTFSFALGEPAELGEPPQHPFHYVFAPGLNPQWLAMEGSRQLDERRHRGEALEPLRDAHPPVPALQTLLGEAPVAAAGTPPPAPSPIPATAGPLVFFIDDDDVTRERLAEAIHGHGVPVRAFGDPARFQEAVAEAVELGRGPALLIDLIMPRSDGGGILGGLEMLEQVRSAHPGLPVLMITDHPNSDALKQATALGVESILAKPRKDEVRGPGGEASLQELAALIVERLRHGSDEARGPAEGVQVSRLPGVLPDDGDVSESSGLFNLGIEMRRELGDNDPDFVPAKGPQSPGLHLLRGMLAELQNPALGGGIILLVLRFASELMNRAVIFVVKEREIVGLGQFGIESAEGPADVLVRKISIPRGAGSVFDHVVTQMAAQRAKLGTGMWDRYLVEKFGGVPVDVFLGPIVSEGKVVAVLYGDNLPEMRPVGDTEALEIFLSQAGIAMEKALLERRLRGRDEG